MAISKCVHNASQPSRTSDLAVVAIELQRPPAGGTGRIVAEKLAQWFTSAFDPTFRKRGKTIVDDQPPTPPG